jgi:cyclopropane-fatty-acyl-phospholipid synthase
MTLLIDSAERERAEARTSVSKTVITDLLATAGIRIDGAGPCDLSIRDERFYDRVLVEGTLGLGESYMDGWWECAQLDQFMDRAMRHGLKALGPKSLRVKLAILGLQWLNLQSPRGSRRVAEVHYDLGNDFFAQMLGPTMTYSCGYWPKAKDLDEAQDHKHALIFEKLGLAANHRLLDIGCGWGRLLASAHESTGCQGRGLTISEPQWRYATDACRGRPIEIALLDYRDPAAGAGGPFDRIVSVGMFEHVGRRNHRAFFARVAELLADDGLFLLHTIGNRGQIGVDPWFNKYILPNSAVPCVSDLATVIDEHFVLEDWHSFGQDYDRTLMEWAKNFERHAQSAAFQFDRRFYRMWRYYLYSFAGAFRSRRHLQLWQLVLSKKGRRGGYRSVR